MKQLKRIISFVQKQANHIVIAYYVIIPIVLRYKPNLTNAILVSVFILTIFCFLIWYIKYRSAGLSTKRWVLDYVLMLTGIVVLYYCELHWYAGTGTINLFLYAVALITYSPAYLSNKYIDEQQSKN